MQNTVAERWFSFVDRPGETVVVKIGLPNPHPTEPNEWVCPFQVNDHSGTAHGGDGLQALLHAIEAARSHLDASGMSPSLVWGLEPGNTGIPKYVPYSFGRAFAERIERLIEQEIEALVAHMKRTRG